MYSDDMRNLALIALALLAGQVFACCMVPRSYPGDVEQKGQKVLIMHHNGRQELVLKVAPYFVEKKNDTPGYLAWLVTVPNKPLKYKVADENIYGSARELQRRLDILAASQIDTKSGRGCTLVASSDYRRVLDICEPVTVGPYAITPVKAKGEEGLIELNAYLSKRGFPKEDHAHMNWFVKNEFTFLCIHITPPERQAKLGNALDLPPLQISFETEHPYYPAMYSARQGDFSLQMHVLTSQPLESKGLTKNQKRLRGGSPGYSNLWTSKHLSKPLQEVIADWKDKPSHWFINTITSNGFNPTENGQPAIMNWKEDIFFPLGGKKDMPPDWYKGDGDPPTLAPEDDPEFTGELKLLLGIFAVLALVFTWAWLISRSRESRKQLLVARERALRGENPSGEPEEEKEE